MTKPLLKVDIDDFKTLSLTEEGGKLWMEIEPYDNDLVLISLPREVADKLGRALLHWALADEVRRHG